MGKHLCIALREDQRAELERLIHAGNAPARKQTRARILLLSDRSQGQKRTDQEVAEAVLCSTSTVRSMRRRFVAGGLPGALNDKGWPGATSRFTGEVEAKLTLQACSPRAGRRPDDRTRLRGVYQPRHHARVVEKNKLKPWRVKSWCIGKPSAQYVAQVEDVLDVYARPYDAKRPLVCLDEASKELHDTPRGTLPMAPGQSQRQDYEYVRNGVCTLFLSIAPLRGRRKVRVTDRRTAQDFAEQLRVLVDEDHPDADVMVPVVDNLNTHGPACLQERFEPAEARRIAAKLEWPGFATASGRGSPLLVAGVRHC